MLTNDERAIARSFCKDAADCVFVWAMKKKLKPVSELDREGGAWLTKPSLALVIAQNFRDARCFRSRFEMRVVFGRVATL